MDNLLPFVSILIPVRNEASYICGCLRSVLAQDYDPDRLEIVVVDGGSSDGTRLLVHRWQATDPRIRLVDNPDGIVAAGLNRAIPGAQGQVVLRVDGHCEIEPDYVRNCVRHILEDGVDGVGGPMQTIGETPLAQTIALAMSSPFGVGDSAFRTTRGCTRLVDTVPFPAYTCQVIARVGLYDEELVRNQDDEYNYRIRQAGGRILLAADVRSRYYSRGSLGGLWRQYFQYGFFKVRVMQKHPRQMSLRQFVPPAFVLGLLAALALSLAFPWGWIGPALVGGGYLLANLAASCWIAARRGWRHLALLPLCFAILHLSYGCGFLAGLVRFWKRFGDRRGRTPAPAREQDP